MDIDQLNRWKELAQKFYGKDFWSSVFDSDYSKQMMNIMGEPMSTQRGANGTFPLVDQIKTDKEIIILIELPGMKKNEIQLGMVGNALHIRGQIQPPYANTTIFSLERYYGPFDRTIPIHDPIDKSGISAKFGDGILEVRFPRVQIFQEEISID